ncbi:MAG: hypothetical protein AB7P76_00325 [Candidatus Melainabacteria bacterium]
MSSLSPADHRCTVESNTPCDSRPGNPACLYVIRFRTECPDFNAEPGQFVMIDLPESAFFFRRPMSILAVPEPGVFEVFYKVMGRGTRRMAEIRPGDIIRVLAPLGNAFAPPAAGEKLLLVGGGIGMAPLYCWAGRHAASAGGVYGVYGARSVADLGPTVRIESVFHPDRFRFTTDDGSLGFTGNVCQFLESAPDWVTGVQRVLVCGPTPMMRATVALVKRLNPACRVEVSLEEHMPCGTGACTGCVVRRADQLLPSKVCVEGPVFEASQLVWEDAWADVMPSQPCAAKEVCR